MRHLSFAAIAVMLIAACGATTPSVPAPAGGLSGREFWSTAVVGHALVPDTRVHIAFNADGTIGAGAGCNSMGGTWSIEGATLGIQVSQMTEMGCPDDRFAQDDWLVDWLASGLTATLDGDGLVLTGGGVTMTLLDREVADPDQPLEGTTWVLDGLESGGGGEGVVASVPSGVRATIRLDGDRLEVDTGCNTGGATTTVDGDTLTVGPLSLTKRGCEPNATEVERFMTQVVRGPLAVEIDGQVLRLIGPDSGLTFLAD